MTPRLLFVVFATVAGAVAPASAYDNCFCVDGYWICDDSATETSADYDSYEDVPHDTYPTYDRQQEYFYTVPDTNDDSYYTALPETETETNEENGVSSYTALPARETETETTSEPEVSYSPPVQSTASSYQHPPSYETYRSPSLRLPCPPPELVLGIVAIIILVIIGAIADHFNRISRARATDDALNKAAAAAAARAKLDKAAREADDIIERFRAENYRKGRRL